MLEKMLSNSLLDIFEMDGVNEALPLPDMKEEDYSNLVSMLFDTKETKQSVPESTPQSFPTTPTSDINQVVEAIGEEFKFQSVQELKEKLQKSQHWHRFFKKNLIKSSTEINKLVSRMQSMTSEYQSLSSAFDQRTQQWNEQQEQLISLLKEVLPLRERLKVVEEENEYLKCLESKHADTNTAFQKEIEQMKFKIIELNSKINPGYIQKLEFRLKTAGMQQAEMKNALNNSNFELVQLRDQSRSSKAYQTKMNKKFHRTLEIAQNLMKLNDNKDIINVGHDDKVFLDSSMQEVKSNLQMHYNLFLDNHHSNSTCKLEQKLVPSFENWVKNYEETFQAVQSNEDLTVIEKEGKVLEQLFNSALSNDLNQEICTKTKPTLNERNKHQRTLSSTSSIEEVIDVKASTKVSKLKPKSTDKHSPNNNLTQRKASKVSNQKSSFEYSRATRSNTKAKENHNKVTKRSSSHSPNTSKDISQSTKIKSSDYDAVNTSIVSISSTDSLEENVPMSEDVSCINLFDSIKSGVEEESMSHLNHSGNSEILPILSVSNSEIADLIPSTADCLNLSEISFSDAPEESLSETNINVFSNNFTDGCKRKISTLQPLSDSNERSEFKVMKNTECRLSRSKENLKEIKDKFKNSVSFNKAEVLEFCRNDDSIQKASNTSSSPILNVSTDREAERQKILELSKEITSYQLPPMSVSRMDSDEEVDRIDVTNNTSTTFVKDKLRNDDLKLQSENVSAEEHVFKVPHSVNFSRRKRKLPSNYTSPTPKKSLTLEEMGLELSDTSESEDDSKVTSSFAISTPLKNTAPQSLAFSFNSNLIDQSISTTKEADNPLPQILRVEKCYSSPTLKRKFTKLRRSKEVIQSDSDDDNELFKRRKTKPKRNNIKPITSPKKMNQTVDKALTLLSDSDNKNVDKKSPNDLDSPLFSPIKSMLIPSEHKPSNSSIPNDTEKIITDRKKESLTAQFQNIPHEPEALPKQDFTANNLPPVAGNKNANENSTSLMKPCINDSSDPKPNEPLVCDEAKQTSKSSSSKYEESSMTFDDRFQNVVNEKSNISEMEKERKVSAPQQTQDRILFSDSDVSLSSDEDDSDCMSTSIKSLNQSRSQIVSDLFGDDSPMSSYNPKNESEELDQSVNHGKRKSLSSSLSDLFGNISDVDDDDKSVCSVVEADSESSDNELIIDAQESPAKNKDNSISEENNSLHLVFTPLNHSQTNKPSQPSSSMTKPANIIQETSDTQKTVKEPPVFKFYCQDQKTIAQLPEGIIHNEKICPEKSIDTDGDDMLPCSDRPVFQLPDDEVFKLDESEMENSNIKVSLDNLLAVEAIGDSAWKSNIRFLMQELKKPHKNLFTSLQPLVRGILMKILELDVLSADSGSLILNQNKMKKLLEISKLMNSSNFQHKSMPKYFLDNLVNAAIHKLVTTQTLRPSSLASITFWYLSSMRHQNFDSDNNRCYIDCSKAFLLELLTCQFGLCHKALFVAVNLMKLFFSNNKKESTCFEQLVIWIACHGSWIGTDQVRAKLIDELQKKLNFKEIPETVPKSLFASILKTLCSQNISKSKRLLAETSFHVLLKWISPNKVLREAVLPALNNMKTELRKCNLLLLEEMFDKILINAQWTAANRKQFSLTLNIKKILNRMLTNSKFDFDFMQNDITDEEENSYSSVIEILKQIYFVSEDVLKPESDFSFADNEKNLKEVLLKSMNWSTFFHQSLLHVRDLIHHLVLKYKQEQQDRLQLQLAYDQRTREWSDQQEQLICMLQEIQPLRDKLKDVEDRAKCEYATRLRYETIEKSLHITIAQLTAKINILQSKVKPAFVDSLQKKLNHSQHKIKMIKRDFEELSLEVKYLRTYVSTCHLNLEKVDKKLLWALKLVQSINGTEQKLSDEDSRIIEESYEEVEFKLRNQYVSFKETQKRKFKGRRLELTLIPNFDNWISTFKSSEKQEIQTEEMLVSDTEKEAQEVEKILLDSYPEEDVPESTENRSKLEEKEEETEKDLINAEQSCKREELKREIPKRKRKSTRVKRSSSNKITQQTSSISKVRPCLRKRSLTDDSRLRCNSKRIKILKEIGLELSDSESEEDSLGCQTSIFGVQIPNNKNVSSKSKKSEKKLVEKKENFTSGLCKKFLLEKPDSVKAFEESQSLRDLSMARNIVFEFTVPPLRLEPLDSDHSDEDASTRSKRVTRMNSTGFSITPESVIEEPICLTSKPILKLERLPSLLEQSGATNDIFPIKIDNQFQSNTKNGSKEEIEATDFRWSNLERDSLESKDLKDLIPQNNKISQTSDIEEDHVSSDESNLDSSYLQDLPSDIEDTKSSFIEIKSQNDGVKLNSQEVPIPNYASSLPTQFTVCDLIPEEENHVVIEEVNKSVINFYCVNSQPKEGIVSAPEKLVSEEQNLESISPLFSFPLEPLTKLQENTPEGEEMDSLLTKLIDSDVLIEGSVWEKSLKQLRSKVQSNPKGNLSSKLQLLVRCFVLKILSLDIVNDQLGVVDIQPDRMKRLIVVSKHLNWSLLDKYVLDNLINGVLHTTVLNGTLRPSSLAAASYWYLSSMRRQNFDSKVENESRFSNCSRAFILDLISTNRGLCHKALLVIVDQHMGFDLRPKETFFENCWKEMLFWMSFHGSWIGSNSVREELIHRLSIKLKMKQPPPKDLEFVLRSLLKESLDVESNDCVSLEGLMLLVWKYSSPLWLIETFRKLLNEICFKEEKLFQKLQNSIKVIMRKCDWTDEQQEGINQCWTE